MNSWFGLRHFFLKMFVRSDQKDELDNNSYFVMALLRIFCRALIFILRLRFPPGSSIASMLKQCLENIGKGLLHACISSALDEINYNNHMEDFVLISGRLLSACL